MTIILIVEGPCTILNINVAIEGLFLHCCFGTLNKMSRVVFIKTKRLSLSNFLPDIIDPAVLRPGRLDKTLYVGLPPPADRRAILITITKVRWMKVTLITK